MNSGRHMLTSPIWCVNHRKQKMSFIIIRQTKKELNFKLFKRGQEQVCDFLFTFIFEIFCFEMGWVLLWLIFNLNLNSKLSKFHVHLPVLKGMEYFRHLIHTVLSQAKAMKMPWCNLVKIYISLGIVQLQLKWEWK